MRSGAVVLSMVVIPLVVAILGNYVAIRWAERTRLPERRKDPPRRIRQTAGGAVRQVVAGPAIGTTQLVDNSRHHTNVTNNFGSSPRKSDEEATDELLTHVAIAVVAVIVLATIFVFVWRWIPVVSTTISATLLAVTWGIFGWFDLRSSQNARSARRLALQATLVVLLLQVTVALAPFAPQPNFGTLGEVIHQVPGHDLGTTAKWFMYEYGWGPTASVASQAAGLALVLALSGMVAWRLLRRMVLLLYEDGVRSRLTAWMGRTTTQETLRTGWTGLVVVWILLVALALGGGGALARTIQG